MSKKSRQSNLKHVTIIAGYKTIDHHDQIDGERTKITNQMQLK